MSIFSRGGDIIDLPEMQRRGLVKFPEIEEEIDELDFTNHALVLPTPPVQTISPTPTISTVSDFLSDFSNIGASNVSSDVSKNQKSSDFDDRRSEGRNDRHNIESVKLVQDLKWRLENTEYKMEQLMERLTAIENRFT